MPLIKLPGLRRQPPSRRLAEAYQVSGAILLTLDQLGLVDGDRGLSFRHVALHNEQYLVATIDTRDLPPNLVKELRRYRLTVQLRAAVQRPVMAVHRQDWIEFAVDLGAPPPVKDGWQQFSVAAFLRPRSRKQREKHVHLLGAPQPGAISHLEAQP